MNAARQFDLILAASGSGGGGKRTVQADRRRSSGTTDSGARQQAPAPRRQTPARPSSGGSSGGGVRPPTGGGGLPGGGLPGGGGLSLGKNPIIGIIVLIVLLVLGATQFFGGDEGGSDSGQTAVSLPAPSSPIVRTPAAISAPAPPALPLDTLTAPQTAVYNPNQTWTILLYQDADDKILEQDILIDLNEAERVGSTSRVNIVAQIDRYQGGYAGDGDWSGTRRYYVTKDNDLERLGSQLLMDLGELNMGDSRTLIDFVTWGIANYPADNYVLIMSDHGMGWPGGWTDKSPARGGDPAIPLAATLGGQLYLHDLDSALAEIRQRSGISHFELIGMDACLMGHLEVFAMLAPHARYAVASQEVEPALGWAYTGFLQALVDNPGMSGAELAQAIVDTYIVADQRIQDAQARAQMYQRGSPLGGLFTLLGSGGGGSTPSAEQVAAQMGQGVTLTAVDLTALPELMTSLNNFAYLIQESDQRLIAQARTYAQSFTNVFGNNVPPSYIDLAHFVQLLQRESGDVAIRQAGDDLLEALESAVIAARRGPKKPAANGISIYFPNSQLYQLPATGMPSYTAVANRFAAVSLWDDFLTYHYTGRRFNIDATPLETAVRDGVVPPGAGNLSATPVTASQDRVARGQTIRLSSDISGSQIGHIYFFAGYFDQEANAIFVADTDYLESATVRELDGVYYPDWGEGEFTLTFNWEPIVYGISDGTTTAVALLQPRTFGLTRAEATYTVDGLYTYTSGERRYARLIFRDGVLLQVLGFNGTTPTGAAREIIPSSGDRFTVLEQWWDLDANGRVRQESTQEGETLTFGAQMFTWEELDAAPGPYMVGFIIEDLDGNRIQTFTAVTVR